MVPLVTWVLPFAFAFILTVSFWSLKRYINLQQTGWSMDILDALHTLENSPHHKKWRAKHNSAYFSHAFKMFQDEHKEWQLGFYEPKTEKITTFLVSPEKVEQRTAEEVFKNEEHVEKLELPENILPLNDVLMKTAQFQQQNYPKDKSMKTIALLQSLPEYGSVWNITLVTQAFNTLNMKLHPSTGEILNHKMSSIFSFRQAD